MDDTLIEDFLKAKAELITNFKQSDMSSPVKNGEFFKLYAEHYINLAQNIKDANKLFALKACLAAYKFGQAYNKINESEQYNFSPLDRIFEDIVNINENTLAKAEINEIFTCLLQNTKSGLESLKENGTYKFESITSNIPKFNKEISAELKRILAKVFSQSIKILGKPPCKFAFIIFGSLSRESATPYSDIEFGILIPEKNYIIEEYFTKLSALANYQIIFLGQSSLPLSYFEIDNSQGFNFDYLVRPGFQFDLGGKTPLGREDFISECHKCSRQYSLIAEPHSMANNFSINSGQDFGLICIDMLEYSYFKLDEDDEALFTEFNNAIQSKLTETYNNRILHVDLAKRILQDGFNNSLESDLYKYRIRIDEPDMEGALFSIKKEIYRLPDRIIAGLKIYYNIKSNSLWEILKALNTSLSDEQLKCINKLVSISSLLRLQTYLHNQGQIESVVAHIDPELAREAEKSIFYISGFGLEMLVEYYKIALPLYKFINELLIERELESSFSIRTMSLCDNSLLTDVMIRLRFMMYENVSEDYISSLTYSIERLCANERDLGYSLMARYYSDEGEPEKALQEYEKLSNPDLTILAVLYEKTGNLLEAQKKYREALKAYPDSDAVYNMKDLLKKIRIQSNLARIAYDFNEPSKALPLYGSIEETFKALNIENTQLNAKHAKDIIFICLDYCNFLLKQKEDYQKVKKYALYAARYAKTFYGTHINPILINAFDSLVDIHIELKEENEAKVYLEELLKILKTLRQGKPTKQIIKCLIKGAEIFIKCNEYGQSDYFIYFAEKYIRSYEGFNKDELSASLHYVISSYNWARGSFHLSKESLCSAIDYCMNLPDGGIKAIFIGKLQERLIGIMDFMGYTREAKHEMLIKHFGENIKSSESEEPIQDIEITYSSEILLQLAEEDYKQYKHYSKLTDYAAAFSSMQSCIKKIARITDYRRINFERELEYKYQLSNAYGNVQNYLEQRRVAEEVVKKIDNFFSRNPMDEILLEFKFYSLVELGASYVQENKKVTLSYYEQAQEIVSIFDVNYELFKKPLELREIIDRLQRELSNRYINICSTFDTDMAILKFNASLKYFEKGSPQYAKILLNMAIALFKKSAGKNTIALIEDSKQKITEAIEIFQKDSNESNALKQALFVKNEIEERLERIANEKEMLEVLCSPSEEKINAALAKKKVFVSLGSKARDAVWYVELAYLIFAEVKNNKQLSLSQKNFAVERTIYYYNKAIDLWPSFFSHLNFALFYFTLEQYEYAIFQINIASEWHLPDHADKIDLLKAFKEIIPEALHIYFEYKDKIEISKKVLIDYVLIMSHLKMDPVNLPSVIDRDKNYSESCSTGTEGDNALIRDWKNEIIKVENANKSHLSSHEFFHNKTRNTTPEEPKKITKKP